MTTVETILGKYDKKVSTLGFRLREFLLKEFKQIIEYPNGSVKIIGYGYGPGYKALLCTIIPSKKGIKLGFYKGSELQDPEKLLTGSGKVHRYLHIKSRSDIESPAIKKITWRSFKSL